MRVIPSTPSRELTHTERIVHSLLKETEWGPAATALSSVNLSEHEYKRWGELDFVVISEHGLFALEVKGGSVACVDGLWRYSSRSGSFSRAESPYVQVKNAFFSLERSLLRQEPQLGIGAPIPGGFGVIFASMRKTDLHGIIGGPEMPAAITATAEDLAGSTALHRYLDRLASYWSQRRSKSPGGWNPKHIKAVASHLRPEFDRTVPLSLRLKAFREEQVHYTEEQYVLLDYCDSEPRLLITGSAGCGKTFLAREIARRHRARGERVLFLTGTTSLAWYLRSEGSFPSGVAVFSLSEFRARETSKGERYDFVVVDEGQQVTSPGMWALLDSIVEGGAEAGSWAWFGDYARQVALDSIVDEGTLALLKMTASHQQRVYQNCRNTPQVISAAETLSGVKIGRAMVRGAGPNLIWTTAEERAGVAAAGARQLEAWLRADVSADSIVLLHATTAAREEAMSAARDAHVELRPWASAFRSSFGAPAVALADIRDFRGLECDYCMIFGLDDVSDSADLSALAYIAITRASYSACIACTDDLSDRLLTLVLTHTRQPPHHDA